MREQTPRNGRMILGLTALVALAATIAVGLSCTSWVGRTFPGFFLLRNRVVASVGLPGWSGSRDGAVYQAVVLAVDGTPVSDGADAYRRVERKPAGSSIEYVMRRGTVTSTVMLPSQRFTWADYWGIFGSYLATGLSWLLLGVFALWRLNNQAAGRALFSVGCAGGLFALSGASLYSSEASARLHALAECLFPAALAYLALVFPRGRGSLETPLLRIAVWLALALAMPYQILLDEAGAYSILHATAETYLGLSGFLLTGLLIFESARTPNVGAGRMVHATTAGAIFGLGVPAVIMTLSGLTAGGLPVNLMTSTAILFPACVGYGLVRSGKAPTREALAPYRAPSPAQ